MAAAEAIKKKGKAMKELPKYVSWKEHGEICFEVPLKISDVTVYGFPLRVDCDRLQKFVDLQLNDVSCGAVRYVSLPFVIHAYLYARHATSVTEPIGYLPDRESAFLVPLLQKRGDLMPELRIWVPYLLIDAASGMVTGREVWGYHKTMGTIQMPLSPDQANQFCASTVVFKKLEPTTEGEEAPILRVSSDAKVAKLSLDCSTVESGFGEIFRKILHELKKLGSEIGQEAEEGFARMLKERQIVVVNLKQFRDAVDSTKACYQALVESPLTLDKLSGLGLLEGGFKVQIVNAESHQIARDLGLSGAADGESTTVPALFAFWSTLDFSPLNGRVLWNYDGSAGS
jgi:hypothetical protein